MNILFPAAPLAPADIHVIISATLWKGAESMEKIAALTEQIKTLLKDFSTVSEDTHMQKESLEPISYFENPLRPDLLAYCFDNILGFKVRYRIAEKVNYVIEFDYKGTYAAARHFKLSYTLSVERQYRDEILSILTNVKPLLEQLFMLIGEKSLISNAFSMKNEAPEYFAKLSFYEKKIEELSKRETIIREKLSGQWDITEPQPGYRRIRPKGADYMRSLRYEIAYDIETYIDAFFSALEHVLTLLYPFVWTPADTASYYRDYIRNTRWDWRAKVNDVCNGIMPEGLLESLRRIKEVYRNHNAHGGFSREMMAYVQIPAFGQFPMYIGKEYLKGFTDDCSDEVSFDMYLDAKKTFHEFWHTLNTSFEIPMLFIRSGLPISIDTRIYTENTTNAEEAQSLIEKMWYDIDNQTNMDW